MRPSELTCWQAKKAASARKEAMVFLRELSRPFSASQKRIQFVTPGPPRVSASAVASSRSGALCVSASSVAPRGGLREARSTTPQIPQCTGAHVSNTDAERRREGEEEGSGIRKGAASPSAAHSTARARRERSRPSHTSREDGSGRRRFAASGGRLR